jgi:uncharacterized membrane protein YGL010W
MATFDDYMRSYHDDHQHPMNRLTHLVGIPMIVASLPLLAARPRTALKLFTAGWALQFAGHWFEQKPPSFVSRDWRYLAIGPAWIAVEWIEVLTGKRVYTAPPPAEGHEV